MTDIVDIPSKVSIPTVMDTITEHYSAKMVALLNDGIEFRVAKIKGDFVYHSHSTTDELFYIISGGPLTMRLRRTFDDPDSEEVVVLRQGDIFVVPKGTQHCPGAENEVSVLMAESKGELNTGDLGITERTVKIPDMRGEC